MKQRGFTLVEVLVALVIVGVALPALLVQVMGAVDGQAHLRDKAVARWVARNRLAELQLAQRLSGQRLNGSDTGTTRLAEQSWQWTATAQATPGNYLRRVEVSVARAANEEPLVTLTGFLRE